MRGRQERGTYRHRHEVGWGANTVAQGPPLLSYGHLEGKDRILLVSVSPGLIRRQTHNGGQTQFPEAQDEQVTKGGIWSAVSASVWPHRVHLSLFLPVTEVSSLGLQGTRASFSNLQEEPGGG